MFKLKLQVVWLNEENLFYRRFIISHLYFSLDYLDHGYVILALGGYKGLYSNECLSQGIVYRPFLEGSF